MGRKKYRFRRGAIYTTAASLGIAAMGWLNGLPRAAASPAADSYVAYGINPSTGQLSHYDLDSGQLTHVGPVLDASGGTLHGIEASASFPGFSKLYAFWTDPSDDQTKLVFVNKQTGKASVRPSDLGQEKITGAVGVHPDGTMDYEVYALQEADTLPFDVVGTSIVPQQPLAARVAVLGAAITYGGTYDLPVTMKIKTGETETEPFGDYWSPAFDSVNDHHNPRHHVLPGTYASTTPISVIAKSWVLTPHGNPDGSKNNHWDPYMEVDSSMNSPYVKVLRSGDPVPNIPGFQDQASIEQFLVDYVNPASGTVELGPNQAIFLFELGETDLTSPAADFQDLVVLVTLSEAATDLATTTVSAGSVSGSININPSNSPRHRFVLTKADGSVLDRDDLHENAPIDVNGVLYSGPAASVRVKPKGNGTQEDLVVDGAVFTIDNSTTYLLSASGMTVTVRNDHVSGGKAMGQWWIDVTSGSSSIEEGDGTDDPASNSQIILVDQRTGTFETQMILTRPYDGLASADGQTFYAASGSMVYKIDTVNQTETLLKNHVIGNFTGMGFAGSTLYAFGSVTDKLYPISTANGSITGLGISMGVQNLGTVVFSPSAAETTGLANYD